MELAKIKVEDHGIFVKHNMPCPTCSKNKALLRLWNGTFGPCYKCSSKGWLTVQAKPWQIWLLKRIFGDHNVG